MSVWDDMAHDAGARGEEARQMAQVIEEEERRKQEETDRMTIDAEPTYEIQALETAGLVHLRLRGEAGWNMADHITAVRSFLPGEARELAAELVRWADAVEEA